MVDDRCAFPLANRRHAAGVISALLFALAGTAVPGAAAARGKGGKAKAVHEATGRLSIYRAKRKLALVQIDRGQKRPKVGVKATLYKHVSKKIGKLSFIGWLGIAEVRVLKPPPQKCRGRCPVLTWLRIVKLTSQVRVKGKRVDPFKRNMRLKLTWR